MSTHTLIIAFRPIYHGRFRNRAAVALYPRTDAAAVEVPTMAFANMNVRTDRPFVLSMIASYADGKDVSMITVPSCTWMRGRNVASTTRQAHEYCKDGLQ